MDNPTMRHFPAKVLGFKNNSDGDACFDHHLMVEVTDSGSGFAEIAFEYGKERVYVSFRVSDLVRAVKESS